MHDDDLLPLLEESRIWNKTHAITGMLLYIKGEFLNADGGRFIQVLQGTEEEVRGLFAKIKLDKRHRELTILNESIIKKRNFSTWLMGFKSIDADEFKAHPGYFELNNDFLHKSSPQKFNVPLNFLKSFYLMHLKD